MFPIPRYFLLTTLTAILASGCVTTRKGDGEKALKRSAKEAETRSEAPTEDPEAAGEEAAARDPDALAAEAEPLAAYGQSAANIRRAHALAVEAFELSSDHGLLLARTALLASQLTDDVKQKAAFARQGLAGAEAVETDPVVPVPEAAYYRGVHFGLILQAKGLAAAGKLPEMVRILEIAADKPGTDHGGPNRALGMLYLRAPAWPTGVGDLDLALEKLEIATASHPDFPLNPISYAEALLEDGQRDEARERLGRAEESLASGNWGALRPVWEQEILTLKSRLDS